AGDGERASVNREIPAESARNGEIPKFQKPLFGTTPPSALSGLVVQTFPRPLPSRNSEIGDFFENQKLNQCMILNRIETATSQGVVVSHTSLHSWPGLPVATNFLLTQ
ncbi:hypothetical protein J7411_01080, partial [Xanthomonas phaseoli pv. dieffenbachiae]|nr:hypothetical protein [Xanthomonas phaseoli pv. dieffenbachiae]